MPVEAGMTGTTARPVTLAHCADAAPLPTMIPDRRGSPGRTAPRERVVASIGLIPASFTLEPASDCAIVGPPERRDPRVNEAKWSHLPRLRPPSRTAGCA